MISAILICSAMIITACSSNEDNPVDGETGVRGIAMIVKNGQIDYWRQIEKAFRDVCQEKDYEAHFFATSADNAYQEQIAAVAELRKLSAKQLKGIIFTPSYGPNGESAEAEVAALAKERSIPVVILDSPVSATSPLAGYPYIGTDNTAAGEDMVEMVYGDKVAAFAMTNSPGMERAKAFKALKPNTTIFEVGDKCKSEVEAVLEDDDYYDFVFFNGNDLVDVLDLLKAEHKNVYTFDAYGEFLDELIEGNTFFRGIMAQNTFGMTRKAVEAVLTNAKQGEMVPTFYINHYNLNDEKVQPFLDFYGKQLPVIEGLSEKLVGKWMDASLEDGNIMTYDKVVLTFLSDKMATLSYSKDDFEYKGEGTKQKWNDHLEYDVVTCGNKVALIGSPNGRILLIDEMIINSITDTEIICRYKHTTYREGEEVDHVENNIKMVKVTADYSKAIIGTWENVEDGNILRWEFKDDGTYVFSAKFGDGSWITYVDEFSEYFTDGPLLCMRWKNAEEGKTEERDWWEIDSIEGDRMQWTVGTQDEGGIFYTKTIELKKVE